MSIDKTITIFGKEFWVVLRRNKHFLFRITNIITEGDMRILGFIILRRQFFIAWY